VEASEAVLVGVAPAGAALASARAAEAEAQLVSSAAPEQVGCFEPRLHSTDTRGRPEKRPHAASAFSALLNSRTTGESSVLAACGKREVRVAQASTD
jgi:hypothetical protein